MSVIGTSACAALYAVVAWLAGGLYAVADGWIEETPTTDGPAARCIALALGWPVTWPYIAVKFVRHERETSP